MDSCLGTHGRYPTPLLVLEFLKKIGELFIIKHEHNIVNVVFQARKIVNIFVMLPR